MKKILIIGKKSFLGSNLKIKLKKNYSIDSKSYYEIANKSLSFFSKYSHIINTSIHKLYIKAKYNKKYDLDRKFIEKFSKTNFYYIFLNSRKIYKVGNNLHEYSKKNPKNNYEKNKLITEKYLQKRLDKKLVSLRVSNIIGKRIFKNSRSHHKLFFDNFLIYKKTSEKMIVKNDYKDFLSIDQFCLIIDQIISKNISGIFNVSLSKKVYISEIVGWISKKSREKFLFINSNDDSFTLSNKKLMSRIDFKPTKNQLKIFCNKLI
tara:strand:- start:210 stop:998 length:789 start_codon:yes stop_codon:yes gene_type:complete